MKVAVTGSHGLIGTQLLAALSSAGHETLRLVRRSGAGEPGEVAWDPDAGTVDTARLSGVDAVVHLAGVGIAARRWNGAHKRAITDSRVGPTRLIAETLAALDPRPSVLVSASAIGFYGDRDDELLSESSPSGTGFLAEVCRAWEASTAPASEAGIRTVHARTGIVQASSGGALRTQLPLFKVGLGARLGRGRQWVSWISIDDEVGGIVHALTDTRVSGPLNLVSPNPVTNADYSATLGAVLGRPVLLSTPPAAVRALLGKEMADEMLLSSQRVTPGVLEATGYSWAHPDLSDALRCALGR